MVACFFARLIALLCKKVIYVFHTFKTFATWAVFLNQPTSRLTLYPPLSPYSEGPSSSALTSTCIFSFCLFPAAIFCANNAHMPPYAELPSPKNGHISLFSYFLHCKGTWLSTLFPVCILGVWFRCLSYSISLLHRSDPACSANLRDFSPPPPPPCAIRIYGVCANCKYLLACCLLVITILDSQNGHNCASQK